MLIIDTNKEYLGSDLYIEINNYIDYVFNSYKDEICTIKGFKYIGKEVYEFIDTLQNQIKLEVENGQS